MLGAQGKDVYANNVYKILLYWSGVHNDHILCALCIDRAASLFALSAVVFFVFRFFIFFLVVGVSLNNLFVLKD